MGYVFRDDGEKEVPPSIETKRSSHHPNGGWWRVISEGLHEWRHGLLQCISKMYDGFFLLGRETRPEILTRSCDQKNQEEVQYNKNGVDVI